ncbi:MAG: GntR family transcriptional regulator [Lachnospiraceae bacterium]|nr:GntR family transcriptional regulator [Lachnospiraceae bacterium]
MITIDVKDRRPIYEQIVERVERLIASGVLAAEEQLPSVRQMALELAINPNTIQKAYAILEMKGFIYTVKGRGSFVSGDLTAVEKKKLLWRGKFISLLKEGQELGISEEELLRVLRETVGGEKHD